MIELGNFLYGNSRGEFPIEREDFNNDWQRFTEAANLHWYGFANIDCKIPHDGENDWHENEVVRVMSYYWGDDVERSRLPNFIHKPTGLEIQWYKYPFRDSYASKQITPKEWADIIDDCIASVS